MKPQKEDKQPKEFDRIEAPSVVPYFAVGIFCFVYALFFPLYLWWHYTIPLILGTLLFLLLKRVCKPRYVTVEVAPRELSEDERWQQASRDYLARLREADEKIEDESISKSIRGVENLAAKIFKVATEKPAKRPQARRFLEYYLPTILKLLDTYDELESSPVEGENSASMKKKISDLLYTANRAFAKLADDLYSQENIDVSSDITVFGNLLRQEGLIGTYNKENEVE